MKSIRFQLLAVLFVIILLYLQYHLWFAAGSVREMRQLRSKLAELKMENDVLKQQNQAIWFQIDRVKNGKEVTEEKARHDLGMIKKGETFYQFVK
jgi:cell division protein FtsB